jgi:predicted GTPase
MTKFKKMIEGKPLTEATPEVQKIWDEFDKNYMKMTKALRKAKVDTMVMSELDDLAYEMFDLLDVQ